MARIPTPLFDHLKPHSCIQASERVQSPCVLFGHNVFAAIGLCVQIVVIGA